MTQTDLNKQDQTSANAQGPDPIDPPLPALSPGMRLARPEHFQFEGSPGAEWRPLPGYPLEERDLGFAGFSGGAVGGKLFRARKASEGEEVAHEIPWHSHDLGFHMGYVINGWAEYEFEGVGRIRYTAGMAGWQLPNNRHREFGSSDDFEAIEITFPANIKTTAHLYDEEKGEYYDLIVEGQ